MTTPTRVGGRNLSDPRGAGCDQTGAHQHDETHLQRDLATVRALRAAGVEDVALLAVGLGEEPLEAVRAVLRRLRQLSGLPDLPELPVSPPPSKPS